VKLTPEQIDTLFGELAEMFQELRMEARALRQLLIEHKVFSEDELDARIEEVTRGEIVDLKAEFYRRALAKAFEDGPVQ
jgi:hypothetical protein